MYPVPRLTCLMSCPSHRSTGPAAAVFTEARYSRVAVEGIPAEERAEAFDGRGSAVVDGSTNALSDGADTGGGIGEAVTGAAGDAVSGLGEEGASLHWLSLRCWPRSWLC